ncbi:MAG TPA: hypothetical protein VE988_28850, partial [Gemmataceae bacterium]|nr:hypothetical protein [Gemmataceae bacterium]
MKAALRTLILLCCPALLASAASLPLPDNQRTPAQIPPAEIKKLIEDLGNPSFKIRENANKRLADMGKPAFNALKEAEKSTDAEIRERAKLLVNGILVSDRVPTIVKGLEFEIVIEDGGQPHRMVTNTLTKIGVRITNISKSSDLWIHDDVRPKLF